LNKITDKIKNSSLNLIGIAKNLLSLIEKHDFKFILWIYHFHLQIEPDKERKDRKLIKIQSLKDIGLNVKKRRGK
jgi:hypothetical protein